MAGMKANLRRSSLTFTWLSSDHIWSIYVLFGGLKTRNCTVIHLINMSDPPEDHGSGCTWSSSPGSSWNGVRRQCQRYGSLIKGGEQMIHCEHSWRSEWIAQRSCEISNPDAFLDLNSKVWFKFNQHWHPFWVGAGWEISCGPFLPVWFPVYIPTMYPGLRLQPGDVTFLYDRILERFCVLCLSSESFIMLKRVKY